MTLRVCGLAVLLACVSATPAVGLEWSITELQGLYGPLKTPTFAGRGDEDTAVLTLEHSDAWTYGSNYFFVDFSESGNPAFNDNDVYAEFYANFSLGKISSRKFSLGPVKDLSLIAGLNWAMDAKIVKYLPGVRLELDLPGFAYANLDLTAYIDDSSGIAAGGAPREADSFVADFNGSVPFSIGSHDFAVTGHVEYMGQRRNAFGQRLSWHVLSQQQFRYDLGKQLGGAENRLFVGVKLSVWINKLGDRAVDDVAPQALLIYRF
jgi:nucleoside-specific outer membrane channel protein Tsx